MDAKAPYAEEGRGKLRKATGSCKQALIRRHPNGGTQWRKTPLPLTESIGQEEGTRGTETSKYPEEEKINNDFLSSGERTGKRPNQGACSLGLRAGMRHCETLAEEGWKAQPETVIARYAKESDSQPVPEYRRTREIRWEAGRTTSQA